MRSYLEGVTGRVRKVPGKVRQKAGNRRNQQADEPQDIPERPDLRNNFMGRLRASFDWFRRLSPLRRRAIIVGAILPAVIAFLISMGAVTALEVVIGNSLPCGVWKNCPVAADGSQIPKARITLAGGGAENVDTTPNQQVQDSQQQTPGQQDAQPGVDPNAQPADPNAQPADPNAQPADPGAQPANPQPVTPDPATPNSGTPSPGTPGAGDPQVEPNPAPAEPAPADPAQQPAS